MTAKKKTVQCAHADAAGCCRNAEGNYTGSRCSGCEDRVDPSTQRAAEAVAVVVAPAWTPDVVTEQYRRAISGLREMVIFGGMLLEVEASIDRSLTRETTGRIEGREPGLKGWLEEHCPEINYKTALRFKGLAAALQAHCKVPSGVSLAGLLTAPADEDRPPAEAKAAAEVAAMIEGRSARQLMFEFGSDYRATGGNLGGAGKKRAPTVDERASLTRQVGLDLIQGLSTWLPGALELLDAGERKQLALRLKDLAKELGA